MVYLVSKKSILKDEYRSVLDEDKMMVLQELATGKDFIIQTDDFSGWGDVMKFLGIDYRIVINNSFKQSSGFVFDFDGQRAIRYEDLDLVFDNETVSNDSTLDQKIEME